MIIPLWEGVGNWGSSLSLLLWVSNIILFTLNQNQYFLNMCLLFMVSIFIFSLAAFASHIFI